MKIGLVTGSYPPGTKQGGPRSAQLLVENLRDRGHEVEVLSFMEEQPGDPEYVIREDLPSERNDLLQLLTYRRIKEFAEDKDVIHSYNRVFDPSVGMLRNTPTVATINNYLYDYPRQVPGKDRNPALPPYRRAYNYFCRRAIDRMNALTTLSTDVKEFYGDCFRTDIEVIPNMYDPGFPESNSVETDENELLYVGTLRKHKGVGELIEQMTEVPEQFHLRVVGDGPRMKNLEQKVRKLELGGRVNFEGFVDHSDLPQYYERANIFIHPGQWSDPFNRTLIEAMQMETPIIATNRGGAKDALIDEQLVSKVEEVPSRIKDLDRGRVIRNQNKELKSYNPESVTDEYLEVYRDIDR